MSLRSAFLLGLLSLSGASEKLCAADWPQQLGPERNGTTDGAGLAASWKEGRLPVVWQVNTGFGGAPPVCVTQRVYTFGLFKPGTPEGSLLQPGSSPSLPEIIAGTFSAGDLPGTPDRIKIAEYPLAFRGDLYALCLDANSGRQLWATRLTDYGLAFKTSKHSGTAWELASPLFAEGRLYFHSHTGHLYSLDGASGRLLWDVNLFAHEMSTWYGGQQGNSCAPLFVAGKVLVSYEGEKGRRTVSAFHAANGERIWLTQTPLVGMNVRTARLGFASLEGQATVLCSGGSGTAGLDPETGKIRWSFDVIEANPKTRKEVPPEFMVSAKGAKDYRVDAMRIPFPGYAPVAWQDYVVDAACVGHNAVTSSTWCLKIEGGRATPVWQTNEFVPLSASLKANLVAREGRLYGFDSYFPGFIREYTVTRPYRGEKVGEFQCREIASGKLLWSTDAFNPEPPSAKRVDSSGTFFFAGDKLVVTNQAGLWLAQMEAAGVKILARGPGGTPALAEGRLFLRQLTAAPGSEGNLMCVDLRGRP
jgi:outer membrane protein assembly factor BamB